MNHSLHLIRSLATAALSILALWAPATARAFNIIAKLERDGVATSGPSATACTFCVNTATRVNTSFSGGFPSNSEIGGTAFVDLATGVQQGRSHSAAVGQLEQHQIRFVSRLEESITVTLPAGLPADQRVVTLTSTVFASASTTNRGTGTALYSLQVGNVSASVALDAVTGWRVVSGANNPAIVITPFVDGYSLRLTSVIPGSRVVAITSQLEGTAWAEGRISPGPGFADVNAPNSASMTMILPQGATYTSTSGVFLKGSAIEAWRQLHFGTPVNDGPAADDADPDGDGTVNLLEFATLTNPLVASALPIAQVLAGGNMEFTYTLNKAALSEVTFAVESSDALAAGSWSTAGITEIILSDDGTTREIRATLPSGSLRGFMRLSVMRAGP